MSRRIVARRSPIHGNGVFAAVDIAAGTTLIEYRGTLLTHAQADKRYPGNADTGHTFLFTLNDRYVLDANDGGNIARWINHSCDPNCEPLEDEGRIFIHALRNIPAGEELSFDYGLVIDMRYTPKLKAEYPCWCGTAACRGTLLSPKRRKLG